MLSSKRQGLIFFSSSLDFWREQQWTIKVRTFCLPILDQDLYVSKTNRLSNSNWPSTIATNLIPNLDLKGKNNVPISGEQWTGEHFCSATPVLSDISFAIKSFNCGYVWLHCAVSCWYGWVFSDSFLWSRFWEKQAKVFRQIYCVGHRRDLGWIRVVSTFLVIVVFAVSSVSTRKTSWFHTAVSKTRKWGILPGKWRCSEHRLKRPATESKENRILCFDCCLCPNYWCSFFASHKPFCLHIFFILPNSRGCFLVAREQNIRVSLFRHRISWFTQVLAFEAM